MRSFYSGSGAIVGRRLTRHRCSAQTPILVTGSHRSGTTWVGEQLARQGSLTYVLEPFNPLIQPGWMRHPVSVPYLHITEQTERLHAEVVNDLVQVLSQKYPLRSLLNRNFPENARFGVRCIRDGALGRLQNRRVLMKDPLALLSSDWIARRWNASVLVTARHPAAFTVSLLDKSWRFSFETFYRQERLMEGVFRPFTTQIEKATRGRYSALEEGALLWKCLYTYVQERLTPLDACIVVRNEDLAADPRTSFRRLAAELGIPAGNADELPLFHAAAARHTDRWRNRLREGDLKCIRTMLNGSEAWLYGSETW